MSENAWAHDPAHTDHSEGEVVRPPGLTLLAQIERSEAELSNGLTPEQWLAQVDEHRANYHTSLTTADIVRSIREDREHEDNR
jgi:hypothetical protein